MTSILSYPGSKWKLAKTIVAAMPAHNTYVEVFGGTAAVLITKPKVKTEIYNDIDGNIVALFRVLRDPTQRQELIDMLNLTPYSRTQFDECYYKLQKKEYQTQVEQAWLAFVVFNQSISGLALTRTPSWAMGPHFSVKSHWLNKIQNIGKIAARFERVEVECRPWEFIIDTYDTRETLFYLDPPYMPDTREPTLYDNEMYPHEHVELINHLLEIKGMAIVSGYDHSYYERLTNAGWEQVELKARMAMSLHASKDRQRAELLWFSPNNKHESGQRKLL